MFNKKLLVCLLGVLLVGRLVWAGSCQKCHPRNKIAPKSLQWHSPFLKGKCEICHGSGDISQTLTLNPQSVKWFFQKHFQGGTAYVLLSSRFKQYDLLFQSASPPVQKLISQAAARELPKRPEPEIDKVWFCGLEQGPWIEAEICVRTNVPTQVHISCGALEGYTDEDYYTEQIVPLPRVEKGKTYTCMVEARDINGTPSAPKKLVFKALEQELKPLRPPAQNVQVEIYKTPLDEVVLKIVSDGELSWRLGGIPRASKDGLEKAELKDHPKMNSLHWSGIDACYRCHPQEKIGVSHPVDVPLKKGMVNDQGLPLRQGVLTCATCHDPHGSVYPYLLRKQGEELCLSCHNKI